MKKLFLEAWALLELALKKLFKNIYNSLKNQALHHIKTPVAEWFMKSDLTKYIILSLCSCQ